MDSPKCRYICRRSFSNNCPRGVGIVAVVLIIAMMSMIGAVITLLVASGAVAKTNDLVREKAFALIHAGFEFGLMQINQNVNPDGAGRTLGGGSFGIAYTASTGSMTVSSTFSAMQGSSSQTFRISGPVGQSMNTCLTVGTGGASLANANQRLQGITLENTCNAVITLSQITVSWSPAGAERLTSITIGGVEVYNNPAGITSGTIAVITSTDIPACSTVSLVADFNSSMLNKNFTLLFRMSDWSAKSAFAQFVNDNEAACLNVDTAPMIVGFTGFVRLLNGTLTNSCAGPATIRLDKMTVSWAPVAPARTMSQIMMGGVVVWNGPAIGSGVQATLTAPQTIAGGASLAQNYLNLSADMRGYNYTIIYTMRDNTAKTVNVDLYAANMNACLDVINTGCAIGTPNTDIIGQQWRNNCSLGIVVDLLRTAFNKNKLADIVVDGTSVWPGGGAVNSGTTVNISNVDIQGLATIPVTRYRFNGNMAGRRITSHTFTFFPAATTYTVNSNCP